MFTCAVHVTLLETTEGIVVLSISTLSIVKLSHGFFHSITISRLQDKVAFTVQTFEFMLDIRLLMLVALSQAKLQVVVIELITTVMSSQATRFEGSVNELFCATHAQFEMVKAGDCVFMNDAFHAVNENPGLNAVIVIVLEGKSIVLFNEGNEFI